MSAAYESAKRVALGFTAAPRTPAGDDLWNLPVSMGSVTAEMPFQYFERGFETPEEVKSHKAALMLYDEEYAADHRAARDRLGGLCGMLRLGDRAGLEDFFRRYPLADWLSPVFVEVDKVGAELLPALEQADPACRTAMKAALKAQLCRLAARKEWLEALEQRC